MKPITWHTNEDGGIVGPKVHDGHLSELTFKDGTNFQFRIDRVSGGAVEFRLLDLDQFGVVDFVNGAIVSDVFLWTLNKAPQVTSPLIHGPWQVLFGNQLPPDDIRLASLRLTQQRPTDVLVHVGCAYGGAISATGKRLTIFEL